MKASFRRRLAVFFLVGSFLLAGCHKIFYLDSARASSSNSFSQGYGQSSGLNDFYSDSGRDHDHKCCNSDRNC